MSTMKRVRSRFLVAAAAAALILAACGSPAASPTQGPTGTPAPASPGATDQLTFGFATPVQANPFWASNAEFARYAAEQLGVTLIVTDANSKEDQQVTDVENLIAQGVDGLILSPVTQAVGPALLERAEAAGIPVVFAERNPGITPDDWDGDSFVGFVGTDNVAGGRATAEALADAGVTKVVAMTGAQGNSVADQRLQGLQEVAADRGMEILQVEHGQELREDGLATTERFISAFPGPGFDGVWAFNDETALGAIQALKQAGISLEEVKVVGLDGTADGVRAIQDGEMLSAPGGHFIDGGFALIMLYDYVNGHPPKDALVSMSFLAVDATNSDQYAEQFVDDLPPYDIRTLSATYTDGASTDDFEIRLH